VETALRAVDRAAFEAATTGGTSALWRVLIEASRLEQAVGRANSFRDRAGLAPLRGLRASRWLPALIGEGTTTEHHLAISLGSGRDGPSYRPRASLRLLLRPIGYDHAGRCGWTASAAVEGLGHRPVPSVLADAHARRAIDLLARDERSSNGGLSVGLATRFQAGLSADSADVATLAAGRADEPLLGELLAACLVLDWDRSEVSLTSGAHSESVSPMLALLGPFYAAQPGTVTDDGSKWEDMLRHTAVAPEPTWPALLAADRVEPVASAALRRLRIAGLRPVVADSRLLAAGLDAGLGPRLGAALLCRLPGRARLSWLRQVCPDPELHPEEVTGAQP
jgi:CRISPR-associated protein Csx17